MKKKLLTMALSTAMLIAPTFAMTGCGITGGEQHVCESKCPTCGYCMDKECKDPVCEMKCPGHKAEKVTVKSVEVLISPKTSYYPGEVFDITGLAVKAKLSNGKSKTFYDNDFTEWTHKDELLTEEVNKITFTLPGYDFAFDLPITVGFPTDLTMTLDTSALKEKYTTEETIDFTTITVRIATGGSTTVLKAEEWQLFKGTTEITDKTAVAAKDLDIGETTFTVKYLSDVSQDFTVTVVDAQKVISPAFIEAEDCAYLLTGSDDVEVSPFERTETNTQYTWAEKTSAAQSIVDGVVSGTNTGYISNGASGNGATSSLMYFQYGRKVYFKFTVNVPEAGEYKIKARASGVGESKVTRPFAVNVNETKGDDGKMTFVYNEAEQTIQAGCQLEKYCDIDTSGFTGWCNMFWWGMLDVATVNLEKGENDIRIYMPNGFSGNVDYFEIVEGDEQSETKITSMRTGSRVDLSNSKNVLYLAKGEKLTDIVATPKDHPVQYTLLYLRTTTGKDIPVLESMLEGKVDYEKVGEAQTVTVTDPVSGESASFTLMIEDVIEE